MKYVKWLCKKTVCIETGKNIAFVYGIGKKIQWEIDKYNKVIADVRYEKEEKYGFLDTKQQFVFIKPLNYEI